VIQVEKEESGLEGTGKWGGVRALSPSFGRGGCERNLPSQIKRGGKGAGRNGVTIKGLEINW